MCQEFEPSLIIQAEYENGGQALLGNNLTPEETKKAPKIRVLLSDSTCSVVDSATYTLCMTGMSSSFLIIILSLKYILH